jgi:hypothetical protein
MISSTEVNGGLLIYCIMHICCMLDQFCRLVHALTLCNPRSITL